MHHIIMPTLPVPTDEQVQVVELRVSIDGAAVEMELHSPPKPSGKEKASDQQKQQQQQQQRARNSSPVAAESAASRTVSLFDNDDGEQMEANMNYNANEDDTPTVTSQKSQATHPSTCSLLDSFADDDVDQSFVEEMPVVPPLLITRATACAACTNTSSPDDSSDTETNKPKTGKRGTRFASILKRCVSCGTGAHNTCFDGSSITACTCGGTAEDDSPKSVCFSESMVTDTYFRPWTDDSEKEEHYYTTRDFRRFRREAIKDAYINWAPCEEKLMMMCSDFCDAMNEKEY